MLDLDDLGPPVGERGSPGGNEAVLGDLEHADAVENLQHEDLLGLGLRSPIARPLHACHSSASGGSRTPVRCRDPRPSLALDGRVSPDRGLDAWYARPLAVAGLLGLFVGLRDAAALEREFPLDVDLADRVDPVPPGGDIVYEIELENFTDQAAPDVVVTDFLPPGTTFVSAYRQPA
jgi:uncharacterized repeat protein (TIGR01451 family)